MTHRSRNNLITAYELHNHPTTYNFFAGMNAGNNIENKIDALAQKNVNDENIATDELIVTHCGGASESVDGDDIKVSPQTLNSNSDVSKFDSSPKSLVNVFKEYDDITSKLDEKFESSKILDDVKTNDDLAKCNIQHKNKLDSKSLPSDSVIESEDNETVNEPSRPNVSGVKKKNPTSILKKSASRTTDDDINTDKAPPEFIGLSENTLSLHQTAVRRIQMLVSF